MIRIKHGKGREDAQSFFDLCRLHVKSAGLDPDTTYFVYPVGGFGEFTFVCSLLPELRKKGKVAVFLPQARMYYHELFPNSGDFFCSTGRSLTRACLICSILACVTLAILSYRLPIGSVMGAST